MENKKKIKLPLIEQFRHLREYLIVAGLKVRPSEIFIILFAVSAILDIGTLIFILIKIANYNNIFFAIFLTIIMLTLGYAIIFSLVWLMFLVFLDYMKLKRKTALEEILPEFLRLVSANHRAGFSLEISLWKANRPRFGILSEEINEVAKKTYASGDLAGPLKNFSTKYDSSLLIRVISNLVEGLRTGADISSLLDDVSNNITSIQNTRKELASEVENYMLFITITVLVISPLMFGLTHKMTGLIESVKNTLAESLQGGDTGQISQIPIKIAPNAGGAEFKNLFDVFVFLMIGTNSIISVLLMSMVKYGNIKQDIKKIPVYYVVAICVYLICKMAFAQFINI